MSNRITYEEVLNPEQMKAVMSLDGPLLVIAGAGSGKTRTLVYRVARLVETGVDPENILLLTFTRKAAGEMLDRAAGLADERCRRVAGGTFHSLAYSVLRTHAHLLGFESSFTILDRSDMEEVVQALVQETQVKKGAVRFPKRDTLANILSKAANLQRPIEFLIGEEYAQFLEYTPQIKNLEALYGKHKRQNQLMDYDDLILYLRRILSDHEEIRRELSRQYGYIMVDEYQDTNGIQADIVRWLASIHRNIMVVGDDSQSIYSFRGANYRNMFDFPALFPEAKIIKLEENYRSTQPILTFTNALMSQALEKYTKCLFTRRKNGEMPKVVDTGTQQEQALYICQAIRERIQRGGSLREIAVLFRAARHSFELELELARQGFPFVKYGGFKFMESAHIKDLLSYLRVTINRNDTISLGRILRLVKNIGQRKSQSVIDWLRRDSLLPWQIAEWPDAAKNDEGLKALSRLLKRLYDRELPPAEALDLVMEYYDPILKEKFDDFPRRQRDLEQLTPIAGRYKRLRAFLDDMILEPPNSLADINPGEKGDRLTLSTVHSAKGLEWSTVFVIGVAEGSFPSARSHGNVAALEEERRLMYVASTRAKDMLILCYPGQEALPAWSAYGGMGAGYGGGLSSFITTLPEEVAEFASCTPSALRNNFQWPVRDQASLDYPDSKSRDANLRPGDRVSHPAFGKGIIAKIVEKEKVEVLFRDVGRKLLHLAYTTLEKI